MVLILRCKLCSSIFNFKEKKTCPVCGEIVDEKTVEIIQNLLNHLTLSLNEIHELGWEIFLSTDNTFVPSWNYPNGTVTIPHIIFSK